MKAHKRPVEEAGVASSGVLAKVAESVTESAFVSNACGREGEADTTWELERTLRLLDSVRVVLARLSRPSATVRAGGKPA